MMILRTSIRANTLNNMNFKEYMVFIATLLLDYSCSAYVDAMG